jgi:long-chain acyl-CoA synthetase
MAGTDATGDTTQSEHIWLSKYPSFLNWDMTFEKRPLWDVVDNTVAKFPENPALDFLGQTTTYRELGDQIDRAAKGFQKIGVTKGTKVGLFLPNCPQFVISYYGILKAGGTVVNFSPLYSEPELEYQIEDSHADVMVTLDLKLLYPKMAALLPKTRLKKLVVGTLSDVLPFPKSLLYKLLKGKDRSKIPTDDNHIRFTDLSDNDGSYEPVSVDPSEDVAVLQYTGGTTGVSKGAMLTHANLSANTEQAHLWFSDQTVMGEDRMMGVLPFFHVFAMTAVMNMALRIGAEIIIHPRFELEDALKDVTNKKPTLMPGVPTMFRAMANHPKIAEFDLSSLKGCISGGAPLPLEVRSNFEKRSNARVIEGYGLTETSPVATANPPGGEIKTGSIGLPIPGTQIIIVDREDPHKLLPQGEAGEICIIGPQVMKGYWNRPDATADTMVEGRLRTGDVGYMDEDGYTFIIDRMKDLIIAGGYNIYPRHVEEAVYEHPSVDEVTVIGVPDDYRGEAPKAFIKLKEDADPIDAETMIAFLKEKLGKHEIPREIEFRDELPKTLIGKLSKKELVEEEKAKYEARKKAG